MTAPRFPTRPEIEAAQLDGLRALLGKLQSSNDFYRPRLDAAGVSEDVAGLDLFSERMPFTRKAEIVEDQQDHPPYGSNLTYPVDHYSRYHQTSGTSGAPIRWLDTPDSWSRLVDNWVEVFRTGGVGRGDRVFFAFSFGPFLGFWTAFEAAAHLGALCIPGGGMSSSGRLQAILGNGCAALCCTPTYAVRLGETALEEGIDLASSAVRVIFVAGEPGAGIPATRARIEQLWPGARIVDHHGMTEVGPVSVECPARRGVLHILEPAYIPEVIDPRTDEPVAPGCEGELVLTTLCRNASPLLRYRTGDLVRLDDRPASVPCACGRYTMALPGAILGRTDDMVFVRGVNVHPSAVEAIVRRFDDVAEYRVLLREAHALVEMAIELEPAPACGDGRALAVCVENALRSAFNLRIPVRPVPCGHLPRFEMKARRWVREAPPAGARHG